MERSASPDSVQSEVARLQKRLQRERAARHEAEAIAENALRTLYDRNLELNRARDELQQLSDLDPLTGAFNRRAFQPKFSGELERARRYGRPLSVMFLDLDHFKTVNDTHGHAVGDLVLRTVADAIRRACRATDVLARFGGEEFLLMLPETSAESAALHGERVRRVIEELVIGLGGRRSLRITASVGLATFPLHATSPDALVAAADAAVYAAKRTGRNKVCSAQAEGAAAGPRPA